MTTHSSSRGSGGPAGAGAAGANRPTYWPGRSRELARTPASSFGSAAITSATARIRTGAAGEGEAAGAGDAEGAKAALAEFELLRPDDNARDRAIRLARSRSEIADHAAEPVAIYDLGIAETTREARSGDPEPVALNTPSTEAP